MALSLVTAPTLDPVSLAEARAQCKLDIPDEDALIAGYLLAAREHVETETHRALITQTWDLTLDEWPEQIVLPRPPVQSVTAITYLDSAGTLQTLNPSQYRLLKLATGEWAVCRAYGVVWPAVQSIEACITVRFVCGYGSAPGSIPEALRQAILLLVEHWHKNRSAVSEKGTEREIPLGVERLIFPHRVFY